MKLFSEIHIPFEEPVMIFFIVLVIILLSPVILRRLRIPSIIGLIIAGIIVGPYGFHILQRDASVELFGTVGLLFLMFLVGLELDMIEFKQKRNRIIFYGFLTFFFPAAFGFSFLYFFLNWSIVSSILIGIMLSTHTLIAFPIASKLGITKNKAIIVVLGGTIITDTSVLIVLAITTGASEGDLGYLFWIRLILSLVALSTIVLWGFPKITRWFFRNIENESSMQFVFVLALLFLSAVLAEFIHLEPIIGAFLSGLALNKLIPKQSALMRRIEFVGNSIFIPYFLISVGMLINLNALISDTRGVLITGVLIIIALVSKWIGAFILQKTFGYSPIERRVVFGLSTARTAAALAVVLLGFNMNLLNEMALNATIVIILATSLVSSFVTEHAGRKLAVFEKQNAMYKKSDKRERILVSVSNPKTIEKLINLATFFKDKKSDDPLYVLTVVKDKHTDEERKNMEKVLEKTIQHAEEKDVIIESITKTDISIPSGIINSIQELETTDLIIGWNDKHSTRNYLYGSILDHLLENCEKTIMVSRLQTQINYLRKVKILVPENAEYEPGFNHWLEKLINIDKPDMMSYMFYAPEATTVKIKEKIDSKEALKTSYYPVPERNEVKKLLKGLYYDTLLMIISARRGTISYAPELEFYPRLLNKYAPNKNFVIIYPEQFRQAYCELTYNTAEVNVPRIDKKLGIIKKRKTPR